MFLLSTAFLSAAAKLLHRLLSILIFISVSSSYFTEKASRIPINMACRHGGNRAAARRSASYRKRRHWRISSLRSGSLMIKRKRGSGGRFAAVPWGTRISADFSLFSFFCKICRGEGTQMILPTAKSSAFCYRRILQEQKQEKNPRPSALATGDAEGSRDPRLRSILKNPERSEVRELFVPRQSPSGATSIQPRAAPLTHVLATLGISDD